MPKNDVPPTFSGARGNPFPIPYNRSEQMGKCNRGFVARYRVTYVKEPQGEYQGVTFVETDELPRGTPAVPPELYYQQSKTQTRWAGRKIISVELMP